MTTWRPLLWTSRPTTIFRSQIFSTSFGACARTSSISSQSKSVIRSVQVISHPRPITSKRQLSRRISVPGGEYGGQLRERPEELSPKLREAIHRQLFRLRSVDEYVRVIMAQQFEAVISRGYSPEVTFDAFSYQGAEVTFSRLNWDSTLRAFRETRKEGKSFPLRTPAFNVSERGIELLSKPSPEQYAQLHKEYSL